MTNPACQPLLSTRVAPQWVDYNGHMNDAAYALVFSQAVEALLDRIGLDAAGRERHGYTVYTLETHLCYLREAARDQPLTVDVTLLDRDLKRLHMFFTLRDEAGEALATSEQMLMGIETVSGRPGPWPQAVDRALSVFTLMPVSEWPAQAGRQIAIRHR